jgi:hypothetical protein
MLSSPQYQFWAGDSGAGDGNTTAFPEVLAGLSDATASGNPTLNEAFSGYDGIVYDGNDYHEISGNGSVSSTPWTVLMVVYADNWGDSGGNEAFYGFDTSSLLVQTDGSISANSSATGDPGSTTATLNTSAWTTVGISVDGSDADHYVNGSFDFTGSFTDTSTPEATFSRIADGDTGNSLTNVYVNEMVISDVDETNQAVSDFHNDRIPP